MLTAYGTKPSWGSGNTLFRKGEYSWHPFCVGILTRLRIGALVQHLRGLQYRVNNTFYDFPDSDRTRIVAETSAAIQDIIDYTESVEKGGPISDRAQEARPGPLTYKILDSYTKLTTAFTEGEVFSNRTLIECIPAEVAQSISASIQDVRFAHSALYGAIDVRLRSDNILCVPMAVTESGRLENYTLDVICTLLLNEPRIGPVFTLEDPAKEPYRLYEAMDAERLDFIRWLIARNTTVLQVCNYLITRTDLPLPPVLLSAIIATTPPDRSWRNKSLYTLIMELLPAVYQYSYTMYALSASYQSMCIKIAANDRVVTQCYAYLRSLFGGSAAVSRTRERWCMRGHFFFQEPIYSNVHVSSMFHMLMLASCQYQKILADISSEQLYADQAGSINNAFTSTLSESMYARILLGFYSGYSESLITGYEDPLSTLHRKAPEFARVPFPEHSMPIVLGKVNPIYVPTLTVRSKEDGLVYVLVPSTERAAASLRKVYGMPPRNALAKAPPKIDYLAAYTSPEFGRLISRNERLQYSGFKDIKAFCTGNDERPQQDIPLDELFHAFLLTLEPHEFL